MYNIHNEASNETLRSSLCVHEVLRYLCVCVAYIQYINAHTHTRTQYNICIQENDRHVCVLYVYNMHVYIRVRMCVLLYIIYEKSIVARCKWVA